MALIFDTSVLISLEKEDAKTISEISLLRRIHYTRPQITFISVFEFTIGIKNRSPKNKAKAIDFLNEFNCLHATKKTAEIISDLKVKYDKIGINLSLADLIIAGQAKENNMTLLTMDKAFGKIEEISKIILNAG